MYTPEIFYILVVLSVFVVAIAAVYGSVAAGFKRNFSFFTAFGTYDRIHLTSCTAVTASVLTGFPCLATRRAALGFVFKTFGLVKFLFLSGECEGRTAICTLDGLVLKSHWMTSSI
jgi:hypothetical protein